MTTPLLDQEEYIEQAYFFRTFRERLDENMSAQEILRTIHEEILSTTKLPMALEFLSGEIELKGRISDGMALLSHYFTPFQTFVMRRAEAVALRPADRFGHPREGSRVPSGQSQSRWTVHLPVRVHCSEPVGLR
ncbi:MAG: hypothetical protein GXP27_07155 [Planctomycetes bacterium]|nr:hypothetical protein [Planctomycetota bacterium]